MSAGGDIDWPQLAEPVARAVWGDPVARRCRSAGNREGAAVTTDLLGDISLEGIVVELDRGCAWCGSNALVIVGPGAGPHAAALACPHCHRNGGWLPKGVAAFVAECIKQFGPPAGPIIVRHDATRATSQRIISARE